MRREPKHTHKKDQTPRRRVSQRRTKAASRIFTLIWLYTKDRAIETLFSCTARPTNPSFTHTHARMHAVYLLVQKCNNAVIAVFCSCLLWRAAIPVSEPEHGIVVEQVLQDRPVAGFSGLVKGRLLELQVDMEHDTTRGTYRGG